MQKFALHDGRRLWMLCKDSTGNLIDPTSPEIIVKEPNEANLAVSLIHPSVGTFYVDVFDHDMVGVWTVTRRCYGGADFDERYEIARSEQP